MMTSLPRGIDFGGTSPIACIHDPQRTAAPSSGRKARRRRSGSRPALGTRKGMAKAGATAGADRPRRPRHDVVTNRADSRARAPRRAFDTAGFATCWRSAARRKSELYDPLIEMPKPLVRGRGGARSMGQAGAMDGTGGPRRFPSMSMPRGRSRLWLSRRRKPRHLPPCTPSQSTIEPHRAAVAERLPEPVASPPSSESHRKSASTCAPAPRWPIAFVGALVRDDLSGHLGRRCATRHYGRIFLCVNTRLKHVGRQARAGELPGTRSARGALAGRGRPKTRAGARAFLEWAAERQACPRGRGRAVVAYGFEAGAREGFLRAPGLPIRSPPSS